MLFWNSAHNLKLKNAVLIQRFMNVEFFLTTIMIWNVPACEIAAGKFVSDVFVTTWID